MHFSLSWMLFPLLASAASLQKITESFQPNPRNVQGYVYKPDRVQAKPPILVAAHYCSGSAQAFFSGTQYKNLADQHGFIVIYPDSPNSGKCWDVSSSQTLSHNGGGDSQGIVSMVKWAISKYGADSTRVFVTGNSSGESSIFSELERTIPMNELLTSTHRRHDDQCPHRSLS